jgi:hypothetical protein
MTDNPLTPKTERQPSTNSGAIIRGILRVILLLLVGIVLGTALYFGGLLLYQNLVVQPAGFNTFRLDMMETHQAQVQAQESDRLIQLNQRLTDLEGQRALDAEAISSLQTDLQSLQETLDQHTLTLNRLDDLQNDLDALGQQLSESDASFNSLQATLTSEDAPIVSLQCEIQILRAMELLSRSRLYLLQNNLGLAEEDVRNARQVLIDLKTTLNTSQQEVVVGWIQRIDLALENLPFSPVIASDDLEIAWRLLVAGFPQEGQLTGLTPASSLPSPLPPTPTPTLTATPTPIPTGYLTPTPTSTP